ncbi:MAG: hypothetical protein J5956_05360 [Ruminococcus sp.]|nr:hypothetical protein [Ruminococcus sp.]
MTTCIPDSKQFFTIDELKRLGLSLYKINQLVNNNTLVKLNKKMYENTGYTGERSDFTRIAAYIPNGVICLMSAARYHGLTSSVSDTVDIAIERTMKISTFPDHPPVKVWYFPKERYLSNFSFSEDITGKFKIYSIERTVIDIFHHRNQIGSEETKKILKNYLIRTGGNVFLLRKYADQLRCRKLLDTYLEMLL